MKSPGPFVSDSELEVLKALWDHGPGTVRDLLVVLQGRRRRWAYTTVLTLLQRLGAKGYIRRDESGLAHVFRAQVSKEQLLKRRLDELAGQLGDGSLRAGLPMLVEEVAYGQWHRMLFARFLAENGLLMHPTGVAVTLRDCAELAIEEGESDPWQLAARYAGGEVME